MRVQTAPDYGDGAGPGLLSSPAACSGGSGRSGVPVDSYAVGSSLLKGGADFTADVVLREGQPCAKVGRFHRLSTRLEPVDLAAHRGAAAPV